MKTLAELRKMNAADLKKELSEAQFQLGKVAFAIQSGQEAATHKRSDLKKYIAHIHTVTTEQNQ